MYAKAVGVLIFALLVSIANSQPNAAACIVGPKPCVKFETIMIQTSASGPYVYTTLVFNVTNYCAGNVYYVSFAMGSPGSKALVPPVVLNPQIDLSKNYMAHYQWKVSKTTAKMGSDKVATDFLTFTPASGTPGVSGTPPVNTAMQIGSATGWAWEIFSFQVLNYSNPVFPWYYQAHVADKYDTYGPLDMSNCYCGNCDAGYFQRLIQACDTGYLNPATTTYSDQSTNRSQTAFNENKILYAFTVVGDWIQVFYSDEHALVLGYSKYYVDDVLVLDVTDRLPAKPPGPNGVCIDHPQYVNLDFDSRNPTSNVDANSISTGCRAGAQCGRPMPPVLYVTDTTSDPHSRVGDWQFYGRAQPPHKLCGVWKYATKKVWLSQKNSDGTFAFQSITDSNPQRNRNSAGTNWFLGPDADPLPIPSISAQNAVNPGNVAGLGLDHYGAEIAWKFSELDPPLNPSHNYRLQFMLHDGDQTRIGGDVGQACVGLTAACPPGFTGKDCKQCDSAPPPGSAWTWYCFYVGGNQVYNLVKIPKTKLGTHPYNGTNSFVPATQIATNDGKDVAGYQIDCNCSRVYYPCPLSCCGNGVCDDRNGTCTCNVQQNAAGNPTNMTTCCVPPLPPCFNNGSYCSGRGTCNSRTGKCICVNTTDGSVVNGTACENVIPPPKIPCPAACCGNGACNDRTGVCNCTDLTQPNTNSSSCCIGPAPPCYNGGKYCSGKGNCDDTRGICNCANETDGTTYTGVACNVTVPPPVLECPEKCCGNGACNTRTGVCECTPPGPGKNMNNETCCLSDIIPPCFNDGKYCNGNGVCNPGTGVCICENTTDGSVITGDACNVTIPPPPKNCSTVGATDCTTCNALSFANGLSCTWCPGINDTHLQFSVGECVSHSLCEDAGLATCTPPTEYIPPPCPDDCSGQGTCTNITDDMRRNDPDHYGNASLICICDEGFSGINCGVSSISDATVIAAAVSAGTVAAIVIAAIVVCALAGGGAYAVANAGGAGPAAAVVNNPIYAGDTSSGSNPLFIAH